MDIIYEIVHSHESPNWIIVLEVTFNALGFTGYGIIYYHSIETENQSNKQAYHITAGYSLRKTHPAADRLISSTIIFMDEQWPHRMLPDLVLVN